MNYSDGYIESLLNKEIKLYDIDTGSEISGSQVYRECLEKSSEIKRITAGLENQFIYIHEDNKINYIIDFFSVILAGHIATPVVNEWGDLARKKINERLNPLLEIKNGEIRKLESDGHDLTLPARCNVALHSSGTTSTPKTILHTIESLVGNAKSMSSALKNDQSDKHLCTLPLSHAHGLGFGMLSSLSLGCDLYLCRFTSPQGWLSNINQHKITISSLVPPLLKLVTDQRRSSEVKSLRYLLVSSSRLVKETAETFVNQYETPIVHGWGQSELSNFVTCTQKLGADDIRISGKVLSVGSPINGCKVSVEESKIYASSEYSSIGIISDIGFSLLNTWHDTGDTGTLHDNQLYIEGRIDEILTKGSVKYSPAQLEDEVLDKVDGLKKCIALNKKTESEDDKFILYLVLNPDVDNERKIKLSVRKVLADIVLPDDIVIGNESSIPETVTGKIMRKKLCMQLTGGMQ